VKDQEKELFYMDRLKSTHYSALKQEGIPCVDQALHKEFDRDCIHRSNVLGVPAMTHITEDGTLSLRGYRLNTGLCEALSRFLGENIDQKNPYLVKSLILEDNSMHD
jgi:hypothetical protein